MSASETHRSYWVYLLASKPHRTLYVGVPHSLQSRVWQHKTGAMEGFTKKYGANRLVYCEEFRDISNAIARETELKGWLRKKKIALIEKDRFGGWWD